MQSNNSSIIRVREDGPRTKLPTAAGAQILRGRIAPGMRVLDAGCGFGRNLVYLLSEGYDVFTADSDPQAIGAVRRLAVRLAPTLPAGNFRVEAVEEMSFPDDDRFQAMLRGAWRVLKPGGLFFCRLARCMTTWILRKNG